MPTKSQFMKRMLQNLHQKKVQGLLEKSAGPEFVDENETQEEFDARREQEYTEQITGPEPVEEDPLGLDWYGTYRKKKKLKKKGFAQLDVALTTCKRKLSKKATKLGDEYEREEAINDWGKDAEPSTGSYDPEVAAQWDEAESGVEWGSHKKKKKKLKKKGEEEEYYTDKYGRMMKRKKKRKKEVQGVPDSEAVLETDSFINKEGTMKEKFNYEPFDRPECRLGYIFGLMKRAGEMGGGMGGGMMGGGGMEQMGGQMGGGGGMEALGQMGGLAGQEGMDPNSQYPQQQMEMQQKQREEQEAETKNMGGTVLSAQKLIKKYGPEVMMSLLGLSGDNEQAEDYSGYMQQQGAQ